MRLRFSLFSKILFWLFLNLVLVGIVVAVFFHLQFSFAPDSPLLAGLGDRIESVARAIAEEMRSSAESEHGAILKRFSDLYKVDFLLYSMNREKLSGDDISIPEEVLGRFTGPPRPGFDAPPFRRGGSEGRGPIPGQNEPPRKGLKGEPRPSPPEPAVGGIPPLDARATSVGTPRSLFTLRTTGPTRYWAGIRIQNFSLGRPGMPAILLAVSDSVFGHGLFLNPTPWLVLVATVLVISIGLWLPFVRSLTIAVGQMTSATEQIAEGKFDVRVSQSRSDEIGRLGTAINHLTVRLSGFVGGQKRFLGDISHELNSPLARLQFALSILEQHADPSQQGYIADAQEEVELMSQLVSELLAFAKTGIKAADIHLVPVELLKLVKGVQVREAPNCEIELAIDESIRVLAHPQLLARALANILRNAARYAPGKLRIAAESDDRGSTRLSVTDQGPGVTEDALGRLFDPFFRIEADRARATGGSGLGLAIVKTCIEFCGGSVSARNVAPSGLQITITLQTAPDD
jgi:two-component system sensor histidine kinase CpxA